MFIPVCTATSTWTRCNEASVRCRCGDTVRGGEGGFFFVFKAGEEEREGEGMEGVCMLFVMRNY
jgi:hypothetical protein